MAGDLCLVDSNFLIRWVQPDDANFLSLHLSSEAGSVRNNSLLRLTEPWRVLERVDRDR